MKKMMWEVAETEEMGERKEGAEKTGKLSRVRQGKRRRED